MICSIGFFGYFFNRDYEIVRYPGPVTRTSVNWVTDKGFASDGPKLTYRVTSTEIIPRAYPVQYSLSWINDWIVVPRGSEPGFIYDSKMTIGSDWKLEREEQRPKFNGFTVYDRWLSDDEIERSRFHTRLTFDPPLKTGGPAYTNYIPYSEDFTQWNQDENQSWWIVDNLPSNDDLILTVTDKAKDKVKSVVMIFEVFEDHAKMIQIDGNEGIFLGALNRLDGAPINNRKVRVVIKWKDGITPPTDGSVTAQLDDWPRKYADPDYVRTVDCPVTKLPETFEIDLKTGTVYMVTVSTKTE